MQIDMRTLVFDTETTGLPAKKASHYNHFPMITQFAGKVLQNGRHIAQFSGFIQPRNDKHEIVPMPTDKFFKEKGYTDEFMESVAMPYGCFLSGISSLFSLQPDRMVCHNASFDVAVLEAFIQRLTKGHKEDRKIPCYCTMKSLTNVMKLPGRFGNYKWPTLMEAYKEFVDPAGFEGAHDAMNDVNATVELLIRMEEDGIKLEHVGDY